MKFGTVFPSDVSYRFEILVHLSSPDSVLTVVASSQGWEARGWVPQKTNSTVSVMSIFVYGMYTFSFLNTSKILLYSFLCSWIRLDVSIHVILACVSVFLIAFLMMLIVENLCASFSCGSVLVTVSVNILVCEWTSIVLSMSRITFSILIHDWHTSLVFFALGKSIRRSMDSLRILCALYCFFFSGDVYRFCSVLISMFSLFVFCPVVSIFLFT